MPVQPQTAAFSDAVSENTGFPVSRPLVSGSKVGSFFPVLNVALGTNDIVVPITLGRQPTGYIQIFTPQGGGIVTAGTQNGADWNPSQLVLQATVAGTYGILAF
jgi:hypothetical protein